MNLGGIDTSRIPTNFYEQEMRNPKRKTGFAYVGKNLLNSNPNKKISKQELEENLIKNEERKYQKELELGGFGMKVHSSLVNNHAVAGKIPQVEEPTQTDEYYPGSARRNFPYQNQQQPGYQNEETSLPKTDESKISPNRQYEGIPQNMNESNINRNSKVEGQNMPRITIEKIPQKPRIDSALTNRSAGRKKPIDQFQQ